MRNFIPTLLLVWLGIVASAQAQARVVNGLVARVDNQPITRQDLEELMAPAMDMLMRQYGRQPEVFKQKMDEAERNALDQLVERKLILHDFKTSGYTLPESAIEDTIQDRIRQRYGDRLRLTKTLQAQGMTYESYRQQVREQIIVDALRSKHISQSLIISPYKIETYYNGHKDQFKQDEQVKLRMIVLNQAIGAPEGEAQKRATEILQLLGNGASFEELAGTYSEGSQRGEKGDWGWVEKDVLRKELAEVAFKLKKGERSGAIVTPDACYIMLVEDKKEAGAKPLSEVRDAIEKALLAEEQARLQKKYVDRLKTKAFVQFF